MKRHKFWIWRWSLVATVVPKNIMKRLPPVPSDSVTDNLEIVDGREPDVICWHSWEQWKDHFGKLDKDDGFVPMNYW